LSNVEGVVFVTRVVRVSIVSRERAAARVLAAGSRVARVAQFALVLEHEVRARLAQGAGALDVAVRAGVSLEDDPSDTRERFS